MPACRGIVRSTRVALAALIVLISAAATSAQTVVDPTVVEFIPSADHDALTADGRAVVQSYSLSIFESATRTLLQTVNLGKPTPDADGQIRTPFPTFLKPAPLPGVVYEARVAAVGISKTSASAFSNTFSFSGTCGASLTPVSQTFPASGGSGSVNVKIAIGCPWTAVSSAPWLTITGGASGSESGTVTFTVAENTSTTARSATLTIAGQVFTVTQAAAAACAYAISPASKSMSKAGGTGSFTVTTAAGCAWSAASGVSWITVTGTATGSGSGTITYSVAASTATTERTGTITVGGQTFRVTQAAGTSCTYVISPLSLSVPPAGGSASVTITAADGCAWSSFTSTSWITLTGTTSDSGTGALTFTAAANTTTATRIGAITLAGQTVAVTQAPIPSSCSYVISPTSRSVPVSGASGVLSVTATAGCTWTATSSAAWLSVTAGSSGSGNGAVSYIVDVNTAPTPRSATITVGGQTFTVNQNGTAGCIQSISPTSQSFGSLGGSNWVTVTAMTGCGWTAVSNKSWITVVAGSSGTGSGTVNYSVAANTGGARSGTITIDGLTTTISQAAAACTYSVTPASVSAPVAGSTGTLTVTVTAGSGCTWGSFSSTPWITVSGGTTGSGSATYTVAQNTTGASRSGTILVAGKTISFTQAGQ
jgi:lipoprotein signal peptidase